MRKLALSFALMGLLLSSLSTAPHGPKPRPRNPRTLALLAPAPAPVSAGGGIAAVMGPVGAPIDSIFALRGEGGVAPGAYPLFLIGTDDGGDRQPAALVLRVE